VCEQLTLLHQPVRVSGIDIGERAPRTERPLDLEAEPELAVSRVDAARHCVGRCRADRHPRDAGLTPRDEAQDRAAVRAREAAARGDRDDVRCADEPVVVADRRREPELHRADVQIRGERRHRRLVVREHVEAGAQRDRRPTLWGHGDRVRGNGNDGGARSRRRR
jgi:hypothetical protein